MRAYFFGNMYLSSMQQGLQGIHVTSRMFMKYMGVDCDGNYELTNDSKQKMLFDWAENHETVVLLNAGYSESIRGLIEFFNADENPYPWCEFYEGMDALDGALTDVGIILPEKIYEGARLLRNDPDGTIRERLWHSGSITFETFGPTYENTFYSLWETKLMEKLNTFGLAK